MPEKDIYTTAEVAEKLGISLHQVYRRIQRGDLKTEQIQVRNLQYRITQAELDRYIAAGGMLSCATVGGRDMLRVPEVAMMTGFTVETIRRMCKEGRIPSVRGAGDKGHLRIPRSAIESMLAGTQ